MSIKKKAYLIYWANIRWGIRWPYFLAERGIWPSRSTAAFARIVHRFTTK